MNYIKNEIILGCVLLLSSFLIVILPVSAHTIETITDFSTTNSWTYLEPGGTDVEVLPSYWGENGVLHINDTSGASLCRAEHSWDSNNQITGNVTFRFLANQTDAGCQFILFRTTTSAISIRMSDTGNFQYENATSSWINLDTDTTYSADTWYNITIEFNCTANESKFYINNVLKHTDEFFWMPGDKTLDQFGFSAESSGTGDFYCAWIDYSWITESGNVNTNPTIPSFDLVYFMLGLITTMSIIMLIKKRQFFTK